MIPDSSPIPLLKRPIERWVVFVSFGLLIAAALVFSWAYYSYRVVSKKVGAANAPSALEQRRQEIKDLVAKAGRLIVLPENELPTVMTVANVELLAKDQIFYKNAHNGDRVLVYFNARKAFIYDPANDKIVNVGPVILDSNSPPPGDSASQKLNLAVLNGSSVDGAAQKMADKLKSNGSFNIVLVENAVNNYAASMLADLTGGKKPELVSALERELGMKAVTVAPAGENTSGADAMVIVGK